MLFIHTVDKVLSGEKSQTRRIVKPGQYGCLGTSTGYTMVAAESGRWVYQVGKDYAVCPGRGKPAVARIQITQIRRQDVREIDAYDAKAEGFESWMLFLDTWLSMRDKPMLRKWEHWIKRLEDRPAERYQAWALTFRLVK